MTTTSRELAFVFEVRESTMDTPVLRVDARLSIVGGDNVYGLTAYTDRDDWQPFVGLVVTGHTFADLEDKGLSSHRGVEFDMDRVGRDDVTRMAATFRRIDRGLSKLEARFGRPASYVDVVLRLADVLGVTRFAIRSSDKRREITGECWRMMDADTMRYVVADTVSTFVAKHTAAVSS